MFKLKFIGATTILLLGSFLLLTLKFNTINTLSLFYNIALFDVFGFIILITTFFTLLVSLVLVDNKYFLKKQTLFFIFFSFVFSVFGLIVSENFISFFIFYELLLVPSYILVKKSSPNRRSLLVSNYFLLWTQFGSFLVLLGLFFFFNKNLICVFSSITLTKITLVAQLLVFFGFAVKIPLWPFHFWLSKTHVEANTGFSIFLSGILVKAAVFGIYKFIFIFNGVEWLLLSIVVISIVDASLKMCTQIDLKKLVALSTIQEMAFMTFLLISPSLMNYKIMAAFVVFHTFISAAFFLLVDFIYKRYNSRISYNIQSVNNLFPTLSLLCITSLYLFLGLPFTIKFSIEVFIIKNLLYSSYLFLLLLLISANYISVVFFFKTFLTINFGSIPSLKGVDLNRKEFTLLSSIVLFIVLMNFL